jgi:hypothetical protein
MLYCENCNYLFNLKKHSQDSNSNEIGFKFCENCGNERQLDDNTLIYQSIPIIKNNYDISVSKYDLYPRKIIKGCTNKTCPTNKKKETEVVIYRDDNFNCYYICLTCDQKINFN